MSNYLYYKIISTTQINYPPMNKCKKIYSFNNLNLS